MNAEIPVSVQRKLIQKVGINLHQNASAQDSHRLFITFESLLRMSVNPSSETSASSC